MPLKHCADCAMRFHCEDCVRVNAIPKDELQHMIINQSPRLRYEDMSVGARYRKIFNEIIVDGHPLKRHLLCTVCRKVINRGIYSVTPLTQHWHRHVLRGDTPIYDDLKMAWKVELDMRTGTRQQDMNNFVVPIKLPYSAAHFLSSHRPIKLFMQFDNDADLREIEKTKKAKLDEQPLEVTASTQEPEQDNLNDTQPLQPEQDDLNDTQPLRPDFEPPSPSDGLGQYEINFPLVIANSSSTSTSC